MNSLVRRWLAAAAILVPLASGAATYTSASEPYAWISTSGHTTVVWTGAPGGPAAACTGGSAASDDDISDELPIGFSYTFGTTAYTTV